MRFRFSGRRSLLQSALRRFILPDRARPGAAAFSAPAPPGSERQHLSAASGLPAPREASRSRGAFYCYCFWRGVLLGRGVFCSLGGLWVSSVLSSLAFFCAPRLGNKEIKNNFKMCPSPPPRLRAQPPRPAPPPFKREPMDGRKNRRSTDERVNQRWGKGKRDGRKSQ